jgi:hypothetical protein
MAGSQARRPMHQWRQLSVRADPTAGPCWPRIQLDCARECRRCRGRFAGTRGGAAALVGIADGTCRRGHQAAQGRAKWRQAWNGRRRSRSRLRRQTTKRVHCVSFSERSFLMQNAHYHAPMLRLPPLGSRLPQKSCVPIPHPPTPLQTLVPAPRAGEPGIRVKAEVGRPTM